MKKPILILMCFIFVGCAHGQKDLKPKEQLQQLEQSILEKEQEIDRLKGRLQEAEFGLSEKEAKIAELQKKLENFGVFE